MNSSDLAQKIGLKTMNEIAYLRGYLEIIAAFAGKLKVLSIEPVKRVLFRQIFFTGMEALGKVSVMGALIGIVIIMQITSIVGVNALLTGKILLWIIVKELGPLFSAIIVITRSGTAISSELASMKINGEVDNLKLMGINPYDYLIVPRIAGISLSIFVLSFYFQFIAIAGGIALSSFILDFPMLQHIEAIFAALSLYEVAVSLFKSFVFGLLISAVSCYQGLNVGNSLTEIPQAAARSVMQSLFIVFVADGIITVVSSLL